MLSSKCRSNTRSNARGSLGFPTCPFSFIDRLLPQRLKRLSESCDTLILPNVFTIMNSAVGYFRSVGTGANVRNLAESERISNGTRRKAVAIFSTAMLQGERREASTRGSTLDADTAHNFQLGSIPDVPIHLIGIDPTGCYSFNRRKKMKVTCIQLAAAAAVVGVASADNLRAGITHSRQLEVSPLISLDDGSVGSSDRAAMAGARARLQPSFTLVALQNLLTSCAHPTHIACSAPSFTC